MSKENKENKEEEKSLGKKIIMEIIEWVKVIVLASIIAWTVNSFILANSSVLSGSMESTIMTGARVFGSRLTYKFTDIKNQDVIIFIYGYNCKGCNCMYRNNDEDECPNCHRKDKSNSPVYYVKRVIGIPGDHVEIKKDDTEVVDTGNAIISEIQAANQPGSVYVNGTKLDEPYLDTPMIVNDGGYPAVDITVPEDCYYMLGDNRNNSLDSRFWPETPYVKKKDVIAKVYLKYWPLSDMGLVK